MEITEQLWAKRIDDCKAVLLSIPFFLYGFCYMDVVEFDSDFHLSSLVHQGGFSGFRIITDSRERLEQIGDWCLRCGAVREYYSETLLALAVENGAARDAVVAHLQELSDRGEISIDTVY